ncbi:diguanylate cyclase [Paraburkholderia hospita]|uniref:diguanylate cyclase domain-containing protein n=1 Tax=Paraburkholderia hospita TaxID=169430 RepID=UPI003ECE55F3
MSCTTLVLQTVLATPTRGQNRVTPSIRASLVLTTVAERLTAVLRHNHQAARLGGDEFLVVLGNATATTSATLAQRIIEQLSFPYLLSTGSTANHRCQRGHCLCKRG